MATDTHQRELRQITLLNTLPQAALDCVAQVALRRTYADGETLFLAGDPCEAAYFLLSGQVIVYRLSEEGRRQILVQLHAGQAFNTVPLFLNTPVSSSSASTLGDVILYAIFKDDFVRLVRECPDFALAILRDFAGRLQHLGNLVEDLALHSVQERLVQFLLDHAEAEKVTQHWTYDEIAEHLGTVRDVIGRCMRNLEEAYLLRRERGRLVLLDRARLEEIAVRKT